MKDNYRNQCDECRERNYIYIDYENSMKFMSIKYILGVGKLLAGAAVDVLPGSKMIRKPLKSCNSLSMMTTNIRVVFVW